MELRLEDQPMKPLTTADVVLSDIADHNEAETWLTIECLETEE